MPAQKLRQKLRRTAVRFLTVARDFYITRMTALSDKVMSHAIPPLGCSVPEIYSFCGPRESREDRSGLDGVDYDGESMQGVCQDLIRKRLLQLGAKKYLVRRLTRRVPRINVEYESRVEEEARLLNLVEEDFMI